MTDEEMVEYCVAVRDAGQNWYFWLVHEIVNNCDECKRKFEEMSAAVNKSKMTEITWGDLEGIFDSGEVENLEWKDCEDAIVRLRLRDGTRMFRRVS